MTVVTDNALKLWKTSSVRSINFLYVRLYLLRLNRRKHHISSSATLFLCASVFQA